MPNYAALATTVKRLIDANGRDIRLVQQGQNPTDSTKPWRGQAEFPRAEVLGKGVFVSSGDLGHVLRNVEGLKNADKVMLFAAKDDLSLSLEEFDVVADGESLWSIGHAEVLQPGGTRLLYMFGLNR